MLVARSLEIEAFILYTTDCVVCNSTDYDAKW